MNDTIVSADKFLYKGTDMRSAWQDMDDRAQSEFRNTEFSFIFQDNNLMPNFTAYENVMFTAMFQGMGKEVARLKTKELLELLDVPSAEDRSIRHFSGGQRQRLAFARAILPEFEVLFGDEPTGNLDKGSAENVMKILHKRVHDRGVTAIIVSHDMRLAQKYADMVVQIQRVCRGIHDDGSEDNYGRIDSNSLFYKDKEGWHDSVHRYSSDEFLKKLEEAL